MDTLRRHWLALFDTRPDFREAGEVEFQQILRQYGARGRHYHNRSHLEDLLRQVEAAPALIADPEALIAAVFYHDLVYRPTRRDNEARSAEAAEKALPRLGFSAATVEKVGRYIRATQQHRLDGDDSDLAFLLDIDLSILGAEPAVYDEYARKIRREYRIYPDVLYRPGRRNAMLHFLERPRIFQTPAYFERYESRARENIRREIEGLGVSA